MEPFKSQNLIGGKMEGFLTVSEAAKLIGVNKETLRRWDKSGKFPSSRNPINNYRAYRIEHVHQFIFRVAQPSG